MLLVSLLIIKLCFSNLYCADSSCSSCTSGYLYNTYSCLPICPTGFTQVSNQCTASSSLTVFYVYFWDFGNYGASSIGSFSHPLGSLFSNSNHLSPIPTKDRGFYFATTSSLVSTANWILAPDFTLRFAIKILTDGIVFQAVSGSTTYLNIYAASGFMTMAWYLTSNTSPSTTSTNTLQTTLAYSTWFLLILTTSQSSGAFTMTIAGTTSTVAGYEFRGQISGMQFYIGASSGTSFTGFFDEIIANNTVISTYSRTIPYNDCLFNNYYDLATKTCNACTGCANTWPWCVRADCSTCASTMCSVCTGYYYSQCTACNNGVAPPGCANGRNCASVTPTYSCTSCATGFTLIDTLCILSPYGYNSNALSTPIFNINFGTFSQYYGVVFQSGSNAATYAPYNTPDADDPFPVKSRGMYFNGVGYFVSTTNIAMNYKFSIAFWLYPQNAYYPWFASYARISGASQGYFVLSNPEASWVLLTYSDITTYNVWQFNAYTVDFISDTTIITQTIDTTVSNALSVNGYAFYDIVSQVWIAQLYTYSGYSYVGFIYSIIVWQTAIYDFSTEYNVCGSGLAASCLWTCPVTQYYNSFENSCQTCDPSCTSGCSTWGTCSQCLLSSCSSCTNFNATCTSGSGSCISGYTLCSSGNCCNPSCADCYGPASYNCLKCSGSNLLGQVCVTSCPLEYIQASNVCTLTSNPLLVLTLSQISDTVHDSISSIPFSTGADGNFYPTGLLSDPIPAMQRGYYFTSTSYMVSSPLTIPYNFTLVFLIKHMTGGYLFKKDLLIYATTGLSGVTSYFSAIPTTDWMALGVSQSTSSDGTSTTTLQYSTGGASTTTTSNFIYLDTDTAITLGDSLSSFEGFIWQFSIYSTVFDVTTLSFSMCTQSSQTSCLWNCGIHQYLSGPFCAACEASCSNGCQRGTDCNLCADIECSICSGFTATCTTCITDSSLSGSVCTCNSYFYWDSGLSSCVACPSNAFSEGQVCVSCDATCLTCSGALSTNCLSCNSNAGLGSGHACQCNSGYYMNVATCSACFANCTTCSGPDSNQCSSCPSNAQLTAGGTCMCTSLYYSTGASCAACAVTCTSCKGPADTDCLTCQSNAALQADGSCDCNDYYYWDSAMCLACDVTCLTCIGTGSSQCSSCLAHATLQNGGTCLCDIAYMWSGTMCSPCYSTCSYCIGAAADQCTSCSSGLSLQADNTCSCNSQYYFDSGSATCNSCDATCLECTGPLSSQCTACISAEASINDSVCTCNAGWYWDSQSDACETCDIHCVECAGPTANDCICLENSVEVGSVCVCNEGFYMEINVCVACDSRCLTCSGGDYYQCLSCSEYLLGSVCLSICPIGYDQKGNMCSKVDDSVPDVEYIFNTLEGIYYDKYNKLPAITGIDPSGYPIIDATDPIPAYQRGLYFTGNGSYLAFPYQPNGVLLFGTSFFLSTWLNPISLNGALFYKSNFSSILFASEIANGYLSATISINGDLYEYTSIYPLYQSKWNYALISLDYSQITSISIVINTLSNSPLILTAAAFLDTVDSSLYVSTSGVARNYYNGFIYSIGLYSAYPSAEAPITQCDQCNVCQPTGICLPICSITSFYSEDILDCIDCSTECAQGCRNSENCNLCNDTNCISCNTYDPWSCIVCASGFEVKNKSCVRCNYTTYYDADTKTCISCTGACENCNSSTYCTKCIENSILTSNNSCICEKGYTGTTSCIRNLFFATIGIDSDNEATLYFSEVLNCTLEKFNILVKVNTVSQDFQLSEVNNSTYFVQVNFKSAINSGDALHINFLQPVVSVDNSLLITASLSINLFAQAYNDLVSQITAMKSYSQTGLTIGLSAALGASTLNLNPTLFFNFLNSVEIYSYAVLYNLDFDPSLVAFLDELQVNSLIPNFLNYFIDPNYGVQFTGKMSSFGYNNNLFILNCGNYLTSIAVLIIIMLLLRIFSIIKCSWINHIANRWMGSFKYNAFLRLWIQTFLSALFSAFLSILYTDFFNAVQIIDFAISISVLVVYI